MPTTSAVLSDGTTIDTTVVGSGPAVLLPVRPEPLDEEQAAAARAWGMDPALGARLADGLRDRFTVVSFDYEGHLMAHPRPDTLTPRTVVDDLLAVADATGVDRFGYYGYSWLALAGLQLAIRTDRLWALAMGGFPPIGGPYRQMLAVTHATHRRSVAGPSVDAPRQAADEDFDWSTVEVAMSGDQTRQFVTLYQDLQEFDDRAAQRRIGCPRLCFVGTADVIEYGPRWGDVRVAMADGVADNRAELVGSGWKVVELDGLDHTAAMQADAVLPVLRPWLTAVRPR